MFKILKTVWKMSDELYTGERLLKYVNAIQLFRIPNHEIYLVNYGFRWGLIVDGKLISCVKNSNQYLAHCQMGYAVGRNINLFL